MSYYDKNGNYVVCKELIHYYKKPICELRTLCGAWMPVQVYRCGELKKLHTTYKNRVTCETCLEEIKKQKIK